jgi:hypothetical protein
MIAGVRSKWFTHRKNSSWILDIDIKLGIAVLPAQDLSLP